ncbi:MAG: septum formation initiator family protein [Turneriella sp.]|nr:septum formation initiator family protein [Turneriella sp.]
MLAQQLGKLIERSREHWLFVPLFVLLLLSITYVFFISDKGYLAYRQKLQEKEEIQAQIAAFRRQKEELQHKLELLRNKDMALQKFSKDFYLFQEKVRTLKFREGIEEKPADPSQSSNLAVIQKLYVAVATLAIALTTLFFYRRNTTRFRLEKLQPFNVEE